ncbi:hypothetical protein LPJ66_009468 [Kickxella alabastrina]|uniref:Uncharacterized protein n=1 Tax=Kickxella alabastrina TaxID=61397 RepID=A0ACC1I4Q8_9FUNG|nr:hypothetical protein LPJ66_009468 [Kickxella alabastrina]
MSSGPLVALLIEGDDVIRGWRTMIGPTSPATARQLAPQSIRAVLGADGPRNAVHGSDSAESAQRELSFFFYPTIQPEEDVVEESEQEPIAESSSVPVADLAPEPVADTAAATAEGDDKKKKKKKQKRRNKRKQTVTSADDISPANNSATTTTAVQSDESDDEATPAVAREQNEDLVDSQTSSDSASASGASELLKPSDPSNERTFALIKPDAYPRYRKQLIKQIIEKGFTIVAQEEVRLTTDVAEKIYGDMSSFPVYDRIIEFVTSGHSLALVLEGADAIATWRNLVGPTNPKTAKFEARNSLRAKYGLDAQKNAVHASKDHQEVKRSTDAVFYGLLGGDFKILQPSDDPLSIVFSAELISENCAAEEKLEEEAVAAAVAQPVTKPVEEVKPVEAVEEVEAIEVVKPVEAVEEVKPVEEVKEVKSVEAVEEVKLFKEVEAVETVEAAGTVEAVEAVETVEEVKPIETVKEFKPAEAVEVAKTGDEPVAQETMLTEQQDSLVVDAPTEPEVEVKPKAEPEVNIATKVEPEVKNKDSAKEVAAPAEHTAPVVTAVDAPVANVNIDVDVPAAEEPIAETPAVKDSTEKESAAEDQTAEKPAAEAPTDTSSSGPIPGTALESGSLSPLEAKLPGLDKATPLGKRLASSPFLQADRQLGQGSGSAVKKVGRLKSPFLGNDLEDCVPLALAAVAHVPLHYHVSENSRAATDAEGEVKSLNIGAGLSIGNVDALAKDVEGHSSEPVDESNSKAAETEEPKAEEVAETMTKEAKDEEQIEKAAETTTEEVETKEAAGTTTEYPKTEETAPAVADPVATKASTAGKPPITPQSRTAPTSTPASVTVARGVRKTSVPGPCTIHRFSLGGGSARDYWSSAATFIADQDHAIDSRSSGSRCQNAHQAGWNDTSNLPYHACWQCCQGTLGQRHHYCASSWNRPPCVCSVSNIIIG